MARLAARFGVAPRGRPDASSLGGRLGYMHTRQAAVGVLAHPAGHPSQSLAASHVVAALFSLPPDPCGPRPGRGPDGFVGGSQPPPRVTQSWSLVTSSQ